MTYLSHISKCALAFLLVIQLFSGQSSPAAYGEAKPKTKKTHTKTARVKSEHVLSGLKINEKNHLLIGKRVLFFGDSITANGTYIGFIEYALRSRFPHANIDFISAGVGSETVSGLTELQHPFPRPWLHERIRRALHKAKPQVVVACYGMNDGLYHPKDGNRFKAYQKGIKKLIEECRKKGCKIILISPPPFDFANCSKAKKISTNKEENDQKKENAFSWKNPCKDYDSVLAQYADWLESQKREGVTAINIHAPIRQFLNRERGKKKDFKLSNDGIHPTSFGHYLMAYQILSHPTTSKLSQLSLKDLNRDMISMLADPAYGLIEKRRKMLSGNWTKFIGYTRDKTYRQKNIDGALKKADLELKAIKKMLGGKSRAQVAENGL